MRVVPFAPEHIEAVTALWLELHPDWTWVTGEEFRKSGFVIDEDRAGFVIFDEAGRLAGSAFGSATRDPDWPRNRYLQFELKPEAVREDIVSPLLAQMAEADRQRPGTWQVINLSDKAPPELTPMILAAGFEQFDASTRMEWKDEVVPLVDPGALCIELYRGGSEATDAAIVDLHNRAYRPMRLVGPIKAEYLWPKEPWPGLTAREYVLGWEGENLVGYAEWFIVNDEPLINSITAARSHWGTHVAPAVGTRAMQQMFDLGYRHLFSSVSSRNTASYKLQYRHGWRRIVENARNYVRRF